MESRGENRNFIGLKQKKMSVNNEKKLSLAIIKNLSPKIE